MLENKVFKNASWIVGCRIAQAALSFIVTMLTARFLGPSNYGLINYAASIVAFVVPIVQLGLGNIQVLELINDEKNEGKIVGTTLVLSLVSAFFCIIGVIVFTLFVNASERDTIIVCSLYSIILLFEGAELMRYWYQAKYISKYASIVSLVAFSVVTVYKIVLLVYRVNIYWFAISNALDYMLIMVALLIIYKRMGGQKLRFSYTIAKRMLEKSRYYIVANMMIAVFSQTDRIMLKLMVDDAATGIYSAAMSCASIANFVYFAIIDSYRPLIFENYNISRVQFEKSVSQLYSIIIYLSLAECMVVVIFAELIIKIIYGYQYMGAVFPLRIAVWYSTFSFIGTIRNVWVLAENRQKWIWVINLAGALGNVIVNFVLIPIWGAAGAAVASLGTQVFANVIVSYIIPDIRPNTYLMIKGMNPKLLYNLIMSYKNRL